MSNGNLLAEIQHIADEQDWDESTLLRLALEYIENQEDDEAFLDFLQQAQHLEQQQQNDGPPFDAATATGMYDRWDG